MTCAATTRPNVTASRAARNTARITRRSVAGTRREDADLLCRDTGARRWMVAATRQPLRGARASADGGFSTPPDREVETVPLWRDLVGRSRTGGYSVFYQPAQARPDLREMAPPPSLADAFCAAISRATRLRFPAADLDRDLCSCGLSARDQAST
jgi:hypothetical protein